MLLYGNELFLKDVVSENNISDLPIKKIYSIEMMLVLLESTSSDPVVLIEEHKNEELITLVKLIRKIRPSLPLYFLSMCSKDSQDILKIFRAGVDDFFFCKNLEEVSKNLLRIHNGIKQQLSKNIAFIGCGSGATFLASNLAYRLKKAYAGLKVGVVDSDRYKDDILFRFNVPKENRMFTLNDLLNEFYESQKKDYASLLGMNIIDEMTVIPSGGFSHSSIEARATEEDFLKVFSEISFLNDITIFNLGHAIDEAFLSAAKLADRIILVTTQEIIPVRVTLSLLSIFKEIGKEDACRIVLNRYEKNKNNAIINQLEGFMGREVDYSMPNDYKAVSAAEYERRALPDDRSQLSITLKDFTQKILIELMPDRGKNEIS